MEPQEALKDWVKRFKVTWELSPWQELVGGVPKAVGYELRLYGRHGRDSAPTPGCAQCLAVYEKLHAIARSVLPAAHRPTRYDISPFDSALHMRTEGEWQPEVELTLRLTHRNGYLSPIDDCEKRCAEEIQTGLKSLGVQPKSWSNARAR